MKKKILKLCESIIVICIALVIGYHFYVKHMWDTDKIEEGIAAEYFQSIYGMVRWEELLKLYDIEYDEQVTVDMIKNYKKLLDNVDIEDVEIVEFARILYINEKLGLDDEYFGYETNLGEYYSKEKKVFYCMWCSKLVDLEHLYGQAVEYTLSVAVMLNNAGVMMENYHIVDGLCEYYNNCDDEAKRKDILYVLYDLDALDKVDYMKDKAIFQKLYDNWLPELKKEDYQFNSNDAIVKYFSEVCKKFEVDVTELEELMKNWKVENAEEDEMLKLEDADLLYPLMISVVYYDTLYNDEGLIVVDDEFKNALSSLYSEYYYSVMEKEFDKLFAEY